MILEIDGIEFGAVETEQFARGWPWLTADQAVRQLAAVLALQREIGRKTFLIVATTETADELQAVIDAAGTDQVLVVCLSAPADVVANRVAEREPDRWPGKPALIRHARRLATDIPHISGIDVVIDTDRRDANDVAADLRDLLKDHLDL
jgi:citrate lyase beta subunit